VFFPSEVCLNAENLAFSRLELHNTELGPETITEMTGFQVQQLSLVHALALGAQEVHLDR
jgi:hypothetical protein